MADAPNVLPGDKVSWSWGAGQPGGTASEVKDDKVTMETSRGNEVIKQGEPGDPAVYVERSGHDVVKKASELQVEKPGPKHSGANGDSGDIAKNEYGKDVSTSGKPDGGTKERNEEELKSKRNGHDDAEETKQMDPEKDAEQANTGEEKAQSKPAKASEGANGNHAQEQAKPKEKPKPKAQAEKKAKAPPKPKAEKPKRKAATESGEPRRSKRIRSE